MGRQFQDGVPALTVQCRWGSPAITSSLTLALKVCACALMPALLNARTDSSEDSSNEEDMDAADNSPRGGTD